MKTTKFSKNKPLTDILFKWYNDAKTIDEKKIVLKYSIQLLNNDELYSLINKIIENLLIFKLNAEHEKIMEKNNYKPIQIMPEHEKY